MLQVSYPGSVPAQTKVVEAHADKLLIAINKFNRSTTVLSIIMIIVAIAQTYLAYSIYLISIK